jgi:hypothetical protein
MKFEFDAPDKGSAPTAPPTPPTSYEDLLDRPLLAHLATTRPDLAPRRKATFWRSIKERYALVVPVLDADVRVVITVAPTSFVDGGLTAREMTALDEPLSGSGDGRVDDLSDGSVQPADEEQP